MLLRVHAGHVPEAAPTAQVRANGTDRRVRTTGGYGLDTDASRFVRAGGDMVLDQGRRRQDHRGVPICTLPGFRNSPSRDKHCSTVLRRIQPFSRFVPLAGPPLFPAQGRADGGPPSDRLSRHLLHCQLR